MSAGSEQIFSFFQKSPQVPESPAVTQSRSAEVGLKKYFQQTLKFLPNGPLLDTEGKKGDAEKSFAKP
jgi:hypothetical protein